jgi:rsbT co-antagonist protein RsbR
MRQTMNGEDHNRLSDAPSREDRLEHTIAQLESELADLQAVEAELRAMFLAMRDVVFVIDSDGRYLKVAPTADDLLYVAPIEIVGRTMHEVFPRAEADYFLAKVRETLMSRRVVTIEYSLHINGEECFFSGNLSAMSEDTAILVARDVTESKRAVLRERALQAEIIRTQEAALAELSTPLVPITDDIMAMPLIGQLDDRRMERVMAALLDGVAAKGTRFAILDVTGVPFVDAAVARSLVGVARAVQLLGARVILTGIRPDVARTLAQMDTDLGGIVTRSTLKDGIAFAMGPNTLARRR